MHQTFFKHNMRSRVDEQLKAEAEREQQWRDVCRQVNARDDHRCRVCGKRVHPASPSMLDRGHHHHIVYRSKGRDDSTQNICLLDARCHDEVHVKKTLAIEGNADEALTISRRGSDGTWYVSMQEIGVRIYEHD